MNLPNITKVPKGAIMQILYGAILGLIADLLLEASVWNIPDNPLGTRIEWGIPFYYKYPEITGIAGDDLVLLVITLMMFFGLLLKKRPVWYTLGFFAGWYISSNEDFYHKLGLPHP
jgi:hypothetical protein